MTGEDEASEPDGPPPVTPAEETAATSATSAEKALRHLDRLAVPAAKRRSRWDRPPPPHDWRWVVGNTGKVLISTGLLMFAFVAYQLWGTGLEYAQAQDRLDDEFEQLLADVDPVITPTTTEPPTTTSGPPTSVAPATTTSVPPPPPPPTIPAFEEGDAIARIEIPSIGLDAKVVAGVQPTDLKAGPGHYPDTPMPGQFGNSAVAGHRTTYGQPFFRLDEVAPGDEIVLTTVQGRFVYRMTASEVVGAEDSQVVATTDPTVATLTLTTCHPRYTAANRLIVYGDLDVDASSATQPAVLNYGRDDGVATVPDTLAPTAGSALAGAPTVTTTAPTATSETTVAPAVATDEPGGVSDENADAFSHGWFSDGAAWPQVALWGLALTAISIGAYLLSRQVRRNWVGALVGIVPFVVALYFFFQNVNRLLPAAL